MHFCSGRTCTKSICARLQKAECCLHLAFCCMLRGESTPPVDGIIPFSLLCFGARGFVLLFVRVHQAHFFCCVASFCCYNNCVKGALKKEQINAHMLQCNARASPPLIYGSIIFALAHTRILLRAKVNIFTRTLALPTRGKSQQNFHISEVN
jgi:hypothetical protein